MNANPIHRMLAAVALPARVAAILCFLPAGFLPAATPDSSANEILQLTRLKGGVVVHVGCGKGELAIALGQAATNLYVMGLTTDAADLEAARKRVKSQGLQGRVVFDKWDRTTLPFGENFANLVIVDDPKAATAAEVQRALAPEGVALNRGEGQMRLTLKARPAAMDEWTHYLYDATGNAVSRDTLVAPPRRLQWVGGPRWSRHHDHMASMSALVSAKGRIFYIFDEGPTWSIRVPADWKLVARDAFNGTILWKRPLPTWNTHLWPLKSGPAQLPRRLVAEGQRLYLPLGLDVPLSALDAATGEIVQTYAETQNTEEVILSEGVLFTLVNPKPSKWATYRQLHTFVWDNSGNANKNWAWDEETRFIVAVEAQTGRLLWRKESRVAPLTLSADADSVFFYNGEKVVRLDRKTGNEIWTSESLSRRTEFAVSYGPNLVVYRDVVLFAGGDRKMTALSRENGRPLWQQAHLRGGHMSPEDVLVVDNLVWSGALAAGSDSGLFVGRDLQTGEAKIQFEPDIDIYWFHHRCYRAKATDRFLLPSRNGIEFVDFRTKHWDVNHWVRGGCLYGIMPCNGLVYAAMNDCACYVESKLFGFNALAPEAPENSMREPWTDAQRFERGPAFETPLTGTAAVGDWPTFRHDAERSGRAATAVVDDLKQTWRTAVGGRLSSLTVADGRVLVASIDAHEVHALDAATGRSLWHFTTGGRVDSPPTLWRGRVLFGSADGWVYCLRANDGALAWRFLAAPRDQRLMAFEQIESAWPVHGSVLVMNDQVYCVAGRSMFLDGGMRLLQLDAQTGRKLAETVLDDRVPGSDDSLHTLVSGLNMPVALPDVLSSDGRFLYMRSQQFTLDGQRPEIAPRSPTEQTGEGNHLFCPVGFLDDTWWHRTFWLYGKATASGYGGWYTSARFAPAGRLMVFDDQRVYAYGRKPEYVVNTSVLEFQVAAMEREIKESAVKEVKQALNRMDQGSKKRNAASSDWLLRSAFSREENSAARHLWALDYPSIQARAMVLADRTLFLAGPPDVMNEKEAFKLPEDEQVQAKLQRQMDSVQGKLGGRLWAMSAEDGKVRGRYRTDALPVFDGLVAANGRLFMAGTDGSVICLGGAGDRALPDAADEPLQIPSKVPVEPPKMDLRTKGPSADKDFAVVRDCAVFAAEQGHRVEARGAAGQGVALKKLDQPLVRTGTFKLRVDSLPAAAARNSRSNGFLVFGDDPADERLVKCGLRLKQNNAVIAEGGQPAAQATVEKVEVGADEPVDLTVTVDLAKGQVAMTIKDKTIELKLQRPLKSIAYVGFAVEAAQTEFTRLDIAGD